MRCVHINHVSLSIHFTFYAFSSLNIFVFMVNGRVTKGKNGKTLMHQMPHWIVSKAETISLYAFIFYPCKFSMCKRDCDKTKTHTSISLKCINLKKKQLSYFTVQYCTLSRCTLWNTYKCKNSVSLSDLLEAHRPILFSNRHSSILCDAMWKYLYLIGSSIAISSRC